MPATIVTVLRSGGEYRPEHAARLAAQCREHALARFLCLSDVEVPGVETKPLRTDWPGWWAKIEALRMPGPVLYMDLDTTILDDLAPLLGLVEAHDFVALRDFNPASREMGSGLMAWSGDMSRIADDFAQDPAGHMARCRTPRHWGDQGFIEPRTPGRAYWQALLPGAVVSWKKHCRTGVPKGARIICFHGRPKPWEVD